MLKMLKGKGFFIKVNVSSAKIESKDAMRSQINIEREYAFKFVLTFFFKDQRIIKNKFTTGTINKSCTKKNRAVVNGLLCLFSFELLWLP